MPPEFDFKTVELLLRSLGVERVYTLDLFDERADFQYDLNLPITTPGHAVVADLGCLEHVFDTRQAMQNCFDMVRLGGLYMLTTPVRGYYGHGLHVFSPELIRKAVTLNGFDIVYEKYSTQWGKPTVPSAGGNILIWLVAKKTKHSGRFITPQQERYA
jgi:2-polyprenyl-3-methyl-5-hydroxy-6-metoxy-1,4-benzoquinol methylase